MKYSVIQKMMKGHQTYFPMVNNGISSCVYVSPDRRTVTIFKQTDDETVFSNEEFPSATMFRTLVCTFEDVNRVFVGKSVKTPMTERSGGYGAQFDGNSLLLLLDPAENTYAYLGETVYTFTSHSKIQKYDSPVGNNGVPYPFAKDLDNNYYLFNEKAVYHPPRFNANEDLEDPYLLYYKTSRMFSFVYKKKPYIIDSMIIDNETYKVTSDINPKATFDRLTQNGKHVLYFVVHNKKIPIDEPSYCAIIELHNHKIGASRMRINDVLF